MGNVTLDVLKLTLEAMPLPLNGAVCGLPEALSLTDTLACRDPAAIGVNVMLIVQLVAVARVVPQLLVCVKSPGSKPVMVMLDIVRVAFPALLSVNFWAALLDPTLVLPKVRVLGDKVTVAAMPVPLKDAVCGLPVALSATLTEAVRVPVAVGLKVTLTWQEPPATTLVQVLVCEKSVLFAPVILTLVTVNGALPEFVSVMTVTVLEDPTIVFANVTLEGERLTLGATPVPVRGTVCGLLLALSVMVSVPATVPAAAGVKVTLIVQLPPLATEVPQLLVCE